MTCRVRTAAQTAVIVKALREALDRLLQEKVGVAAVTAIHMAMSTSRAMNLYP